MSSEEIDRVNHKARRLHMSICDEHSLFTHHITGLQESNPPLAFELQQVCVAQRQVNNTHNSHLDALEALPGYTGLHGLSIHKSDKQGTREGSASEEGEGFTGGNTDDDT